MDPMGGLSYLHTALEETSGSYGRIILFTHWTRENKWTQWEDYPIYTLHSRKQVDPMGGLSYLHTALEKTSGLNGRIILFTHCTRENKWILWEDYPIYTLDSRKQVDPMGGLSYLHTALEKTSGLNWRIILFTHCTRENKWTFGRIILFTHWTRENKWTLWEDYPTYTLHSRKQVDPMGGLSYLHTALEKTSGPYGRIILFTHCTRENKWILWEDYPIYTLDSSKQVDPMGGLSYLHTALEETSGPNGRIILFTHGTRENKWTQWEDYPIYTLHSRKQVDSMGGLSYLHTALEKTSGPLGGLSYLHTGLEKTSGPYGRIILLTHCTRGNKWTFGRIILFTHWTRENKWTQWEDYPIYTLHSRKQVDPMGGLSYLHTALEKTSGSYGRIILFTHCTRENKWTLWEDYPIYTLHSRKQVDPMGGLSYLHTGLEKTSGPYGRIILLTHCTRGNKWTQWEDYPIYTRHSRKQVDPMGGLSYLHTALEKTSGLNGRIILFTHCTRGNKWTQWEDYPIYTLHSRKQVDPMGGLSYLHTALEKTSGPLGGLSYLHTALEKTSGLNGRIILFTHCTRENKWTQWEDYPIYTLHSRKQVDSMGGLSYLHTALEETSGPNGRIILFTHCTRENKWTFGRIILFTHCTRENKWTQWEDYPIYTLHSRKQVDLWEDYPIYTLHSRKQVDLWEDYPIYTLHSRKQVDPMGGLSCLHTALEKTSGPLGGLSCLHTALEKTSGPLGGLSYLHTALEKTSGPNGRIILLTHCTRGNKWTLREDYPIYTLDSRKQVDPLGGLSYLHTALEKTSGPFGRIILFTHWTQGNKWTQWEDYPIYTLHSRKQVDPMGGLSYLHTGLEKTSGPYGRIILLTHCTRGNKWTQWEDYPTYTLDSRKQVDPMGGLSYLHTALEETSGPNGRIILLTHWTRENKWTQWEDYPTYTLDSRKQVDPMGGLSYLHTGLEKTSGPNGRIILLTHWTRGNKWTQWEDYPIYTLHSRKQVDPMGGLSYLHTALEETSGPNGRIILLTHWTRENKWTQWEDYPTYTLHSRKQVDPMGGLSYLHTALEETSGSNGRIILFTHCTRENKWTQWEDYPIYTRHSRKQVDPMGGLSYLHTALEKTSGPNGRIILFTHCTRGNKWTQWEDYPTYTLHSRKQVDPMGGLSYLHTALEETSGPNGRIILFTHCTRGNKWIQWEDYPIYTLHSRKQVDPMGGLSYLHTALEKTSGPNGRIILLTHCTRGNKWTQWEDYPIYTLHSRKQVDPMGGLSYLHTALEKTSGPNGRIILFTHCTRGNKWTLWEDYPIYTLHSRKQVDPMGGLSYLHTGLEKTSGSYGRIILFTHWTRENKWTLWEDYPIYTLHSRKQVDPMGGLSYLHTALEKTSGPYGRIILFTHCTRENKRILWENYPSHLNNTEHLTLYHLIFEL